MSREIWRKNIFMLKKKWKEFRVCLWLLANFWRPLIKILALLVQPLALITMFEFYLLLIVSCSNPLHLLLCTSTQMLLVRKVLKFLTLWAFLVYYSYISVDVLPPEADSSISMLQADEKPEVSYNDIGGMDMQKQEMREAVELPLTHFDLYKQVRGRFLDV